MANPHCVQLADVLARLRERGIGSAEALRRPENAELCQALWLAVQDFISRCALCSRTQRSPRGERTAGNAAKVRSLLARGLSLEDIRADALVHVLGKANLLLAQPPEKQVGYLYRMVNNCIYDEFRRLPPTSVSVCSLDAPVRAKGAAPEDADPLQNFLSAPDTLEEEILAREAVRARRAVLLQQVERLGGRPDEIYAYLGAKVLGRKPALLAAELAGRGAAKAYAEVLDAVARENGLPARELRRAAGGPPSDEAFRLETHDAAKIRAQISRLLYRAASRLAAEPMARGQIA